VSKRQGVEHHDAPAHQHDTSIDVPLEVVSTIEHVHAAAALEHEHEAATLDTVHQAVTLDHLHQELRDRAQQHTVCLAPADSRPIAAIDTQDAQGVQCRAPIHQVTDRQAATQWSVPIQQERDGQGGADSGGIENAFLETEIVVLIEEVV